MKMVVSLFTRRTGLFTVALASLLAFTVRPVRANGTDCGSSFTLSSLLGHSLTIGDKQFYFDCYRSCTIDASSIQVTPINEGMDAIGFSLTGACATGGGLYSSWGSFGGGSASTGFTLSYHVVVVQPGYYIKDAALQLNLTDSSCGSYQPSSWGGGNWGGCSASVQENITAGLQTPQLSASVTSQNPSDGDSTQFAPVSSVSVVKQFSLNDCSGFGYSPSVSPNCGTPSGDKCGFEIVQTFSQIPEPSAVTLAILGCCGLLPLLRRRR